MVGASHGSAAAPVSVPPLTPSRGPRNGEALDSLIRSLEERYQLGLEVNCWSPARSKTEADKAAGKLRQLYFTPGSALKEALAAFEATAAFIPNKQRLEVLLNVLRSKTQHESPISRAGTPMSTKNVHLKSRKTPQPSVEDTPRSRGLFDNYRQDAAPSLNAPALDHGSTTDEDEGDFVTPPLPRASSRSSSPSVTSKAAQRRIQASTDVSLHATSRKRSSDSSFEAGKSPKLTKTSEGKQLFKEPPVPRPFNPPTSLFKKPALEQTHYYNANTASQSTVNTSFNTVSSSQRTQPDTANTSFTSDAPHTGAPHSFMKRTSSTTIGPLDDQDFLNVNTRLVKEIVGSERRVIEPLHSSSQDRDSSSTWGSSIPEDALLEASAKVESMHAVSPSGGAQLSPQRPAQWLSASQPAHSPKKNGSAQFAAVPLNQSFPPPPGVSAKLSPDKLGFQARGPSNDVSPIRAQHQPPRDQTPAESPSKIAHHIRNIPKQGLWVDDVPEKLWIIPYHILFICQRVALESSMSLRNLLQEVDIPPANSDPKAFWSALQQHPKVTNIKMKEPDRLWSNPKPSMEGLTFKGQINLSSKGSGPVFQLQLHPIQPDKSCRFQRRFGSDRFLYLNVPKFNFTKIHRINKADVKPIQDGWTQWLLAEHSFLGRRWRVFHVEPVKGPKNKGKKKVVTHDARIILFAIRGGGIEQPCSIGEMLNWFLPFSRNQQQSFCKAYARFDLGLSRTIPTLVFKPSQLSRVGDIIANGEREAAEYNDPALYWSDVPGDQVMNDGCSVMSVGAAREIWRHLKRITGVSGPLPSAFQGRIGGAKGMWMISAESFTKDPEHLAIWIKISSSQLKFEPHTEDVSDDTYDPHRLTFEVSNYSSSPAGSELHISFIPIMADRGVPRDVIAGFMTERLEADRAELFERLSDPVRMYDYIHRNSATSSDRVDMQWQAALPSALEEKIKLLLESGFSPTRLQFLATSISRFIKAQHLYQESTLRTPLGKATYLYGVADPLGVLRPGEIHVQFSSSFIDEMTDEKYLNLKGHDVIVARQPACRRSDIQKVRAILHPDLSHLVDLVVFPSRGQYPLAGKLQGGDYDGDIFWLCWEDKLVMPFQNAPAPVLPPEPADYGIKKDKRKLRAVMNPNDVSNIDSFLHESFMFRNTKSLLGMATVYLENLAYVENRIYSHTLDRICDMHDLLVDAPKQGYIFTTANFEHYIQRRLLLKPKLKQPAYKEAMGDCMNTKEMGDMDKAREKQYRYRKKNLIDYLYFEVVRAHNIATMDKIRDILSTATEADTDLLRPRRRLDDYKDKVVDEELRGAQEQITRIYQSWVSGFHKDYATNEYVRLVDDCYRRFLAIRPQNTDHPLVRPWVEEYLVPGQCLWDTIRASTLYHKMSNPSASTFVFVMAGRELARLKAANFPHTRAMVAQIRANMKPKPIRALMQADDDDEKDEFTSALGDEVS